MRIYLVVLFLMQCCLVAQVHAEEQSIDQFRNWAIDEDLQPAALVAMGADGSIIASVGVGTDTNLPLPIASISKTFAGQCVLFMADQGIVSLNDPISRYLPWSGQQGAVTLSQLLTHSSGFGPDATQEDLQGVLFLNPVRVDEIVKDVASRSLGFPNGTHHYNNENYLVLEKVLAEVVGTEVFEWCHRNVPLFEPLTSLGLNDRLSAIGISGGLEISASELAHFFHSLNVGAAEDWPAIWYGSNNSYGPGVVMQSVVDGTNLMHSGSICTPGGPNLGALAVRFAQGVSVAIVYSGCAGPEDYRLLNRLAQDFLEMAEIRH